MKITICGAGNAAHTLVPVVAASGTHLITVYAPMADEAARWRSALGSDGVVEASFAGGQRLAARPVSITADATTAAIDAELVLLALPAFAHEPVLLALAPHLPPTASVGALPARGGFDWLARALLPEHKGTIFGLQTLPWACRIHQWGRRVDVLGTKTTVDLAAQPGSAGVEAAGTLSKLLGLPLQAVSGFLALTLANTGQLIHPGIMYGLFHNWDGAPLGEDEVPLFYGGVDETTATLLEMLSDEVQAIGRRLAGLGPELDLRSVLSLTEWLRRSYRGQITDPSTLRSCFATNPAYAGLRAPVKLVEENAYEPWFTSRYLAEDVPFSLLVTRGIAELAGVPTPAMDRVIHWAQARLGKEYLVEGLVAGPDVAESRAPQRFGINRLDGLLAASV